MPCRNAIAQKEFDVSLILDRQQGKDIIRKGKALNI